MTARRGPLDGAANNKAGLAWQSAGAGYLRDQGWPLAASARRGVDLVAGPVGIDATIREWDHILAKLDKAIADCAGASLPYAAVWKKRNRKRGVRGSPGEAGSTDPARGVIMMQADQFFLLLRSWEAAQQRAVTAEVALDQWMARSAS